MSRTFSPEGAFVRKNIAKNLRAFYARFGMFMDKKLELKIRKTANSAGRQVNALRKNLSYIKRHGFVGDGAFNKNPQDPGSKYGLDPI